jgi:hypothetical protein
MPISLDIKKPTHSLNKAYLKETISRNNIEKFKAQLSLLFEKADPSCSEDTLKDYITDFLKNTWYSPEHAITVNKERKDFAIHTGKAFKDPVAVIAEVKRVDNAEMMSAGKPNVKALHELVLYYLQERITMGNNQLKFLLATDVYNWILIDSNEFDKKIYANNRIKKLYEVFVNDKKDNPFFYGELKKILNDADFIITATCFNLNEFKNNIINTEKTDDKKLISLYKILSPVHLIKLPFANDSNSLDKNFYAELLYLIGLEEVNEGSKKLIRRQKESSESSLIENAMIKIRNKDCIRDLPDATRYGITAAEQEYAIALELCITWINRILFLKLLEAQLLAYHKGDKSFLFLNEILLPDFDELNNLFFQVLAEKSATRREHLESKFSKVPYLNSSLFERTELERRTIDISALDNNMLLPLHKNTVLKDDKGKRKQGAVATLPYFFSFLDSYDFTSEGKAEIQEENKTLINASVLGLIFEKINGYKDGSFFTPGFITMYMCRETLRRAVTHEFNEYYNWNCSRFEDLQERIEFHDKEKRQEANILINRLTICDPAVGSGHFLVSALNELICIKHDLKILQYGHNRQRIKEYSLEIVNDELIIQDIETEDLFEYALNQKGNIKPEQQQLQETLFHEKETLIENCLFGVDINPNSVKICRLRLWIELLKNAYYTKESNYTQLETLPNIDINIKQGNSLISRFALDADLAPALKKSKFSIEAYKVAVQTYRNAESKEEKREMETLIETIKNDFQTDLSPNDPINKKLSKLRGELATFQQTDLFSGDTKKKSKANKELEKLSVAIEKLEKERNEIKNNAIYKDAFEWRFMFPEVLDNEGNFIGFNAIIGNPPYIQLQKMGADSDVLSKQGYECFTRTGDIYQLFYEQGLRLLKKNGQLGYITSNKWMRTDYGSVTREFLAKKCRTELVVDFGMAQMFDSATTYTNILILSKRAPVKTIWMCRIKDDYDATILLDDYVTFAKVEIENPNEKSWIAYRKEEYELIKKIVSKGKQLKEWNIQINYGLKTGFNEAFIIDTETKERLVQQDPKNTEVFVKILRGEDIKPYCPDWNNKWLVNTHNGVKNSSKPRVNAEKDYPALYEWLLKFETQLSKRTDKGDHWTNLRNCAYLEEFYKPKIIYPNMTKFMPFVYDKHQFFTNDKSFILTGQNLEYLTLFLNSKIFKYTFKEYFPELLGETREIRKVFFETVSVIPVTENEWFVAKCEAIIYNKQKSLPTIDLEKEVDEKLFDIYELTEAERLLILASFPSEKATKANSLLVNP